MVRQLLPCKLKGGGPVGLLLVELDAPDRGPHGELLEGDPGQGSCALAVPSACQKSVFSTARV